MKRIVALLTLLTLSLLVAEAWALDPYYHTNAEIDNHLNAWQQLYPDTVKVETIGYSQQDHIPIRAVKISDHVQQELDKPKVLFVGQVHAEEILGVEVVMSFLDTLLIKRLVNPYKVWLDTLEIWLVPTANPEGHQVVMDEWDVTYRKNKRDCNLDGRFTFHAGAGGDTDGVDINRNFSFNWIHGDPYLAQSPEPYDYFRGFAPMSESETQALDSLGRVKKFAFSIVWHSSRTGNNSEKVFFPWNWDESNKLPPDYNVLISTAQAVAAAIPTYTQQNPPTYTAWDSNEPRGCQHDAFYAAFGTIPLLIECGTSFIQPPDSIAKHVVKDNLNAITWILNRASGYIPATNKAQITGKVTGTTGNPLPAVVTILEQDSPLLTPRTCDSFGRYRRYLMSDTYTVQASLRGYFPQQASVYTSVNSAAIQNFTLQARPVHTFSGELISLDRDPLSGTLFLQGEDVLDKVLVGSNGQFAHLLPEGSYRVIIDSPGRVVRFDSLNLDQDRYIIFQLPAAQVIFSDDFESGLSNWTHGGTHDYWSTEMDTIRPDGGTVGTDRPNLDYEPNTSTWLEKAVPLVLSTAQTAAIRFQQWYYFEPRYDSAMVQASVDNGTSWHTICGPFDRQNVGWETAYANLTPYCGQSSVRLRWLISTDANLNEQGWHLDDVQIQTADTFVAVEPETAPPRRFDLIQVYPNPFNSQLSILLDLWQTQSADLTLWDVAGRQVARIHSGKLTAGEHRISWQSPLDLATGIYLLRIEYGTKTDVRKVLFLK